MVGLGITSKSRLVAFDILPVVLDQLEVMSADFQWVAGMGTEKNRSAQSAGITALSAHETAVE